MTKQELVLDNPNYKAIHNHGFVGILETMGSDADIADAARVSYGKGTKSVSDDRNLLRYLMRHKHTSPFEMAEVKFHLKVPIFIMRQLVRHRTANLNEYSGRYSEMSDEFYLPEFDYIAPQSTTNKQGRAGTVEDRDKFIVQDEMQRAYDESYHRYQTLLGEEGQDRFSDDFEGISRELARGVLSVANYTECYWKIDLHNFFHFCRLRLDSHAQREIRDFAQAMYDFAKPYFPLSMEAFEDYVLNSRTLSRMDITALQDMLSGEFVEDAAHYGMSKREYTEFVDFFKPSALHSYKRFKTEDD
jgi:thymidylate synthase (FAD)